MSSKNLFTKTALAALCLVIGSGCALTQKAVPVDARYFSPEPAVAALPSHDRAAGTPFELRLGRVTGSAYIRERMIYRDSQYELGFYDDRLWTERPDAYLRRALTQALFEDRNLRSVIAGAAPVLDVELIRFEEVRKPQHTAAVSINYALRDDRVVRRAQTITLELPIPQVEKADAPGAVAATLGQALRSAVAQIADQILAELAQPAPLPAPKAATR